MKKHVSGHNSARFCPLGLRFCMHLGPSKIKILTNYGALGPLNKGLNEEVKWQKIHSKFKELVKKYHPDKNHGNKEFEEKLKKITLAYSQLKKTLGKK